ncbi:MAG: TIGR00282 family metallophosphoesterase [candidate division WWE3 bacterium]|nr:TIGR00282 family metallophosphoesterase [candidate division WWE3 bacterium]
MIKILFIGDVVGSLGRLAVSKILPTLKKGDSINIVIANGENLAHGRGASQKTVTELLNSGVDVLTSGDHIFYREEFKNEIVNLPVIRPANFPDSEAGLSYYIFDLGKKGRFLICNLLGSTFIDYPDLRNPFLVIDNLLRQFEGEKLAGILVDFHAEATSEKMAMGWFLDGRVSAVVGTHTHVGTADVRILPLGTAYVTDVGMCGSYNSVLGVKKEIIIDRFVNQGRQRFDWDSCGPAIFSSVEIKINDKTGKATGIKRVDKLI